MVGEVDRNGDHTYLLGCQPHRKRTREVFNENRDKPFDGARHRAMDDHGPMRCVVVAGVGQVEPLRRVVIQLNRPQLPRPTNAVGHIEIDFRAVERAIAFLQFVFAASGLERRPQRGFGAIPQGVGADTLGRARGKFESRRQTKRGVVAENEVHQELHFGRDLVLAQEHMTIVLRKLPYPCEAGQRTGQLIAVQHIKRDVPHGQFAIRMLVRCEVQIVRRTVHRFERHVVLARFVVQHQKHVLAILAPMSRLLPQRLVIQQRRLDLLERLLLPLAHERFQRVVEHRALGRPEYCTRRHGEQLEQIERSTQHAVITLLRFLQLIEVRVELVFPEEGGGIDALQHLSLHVAAPIGASRRKQLEMSEHRRVRHVRPATEVDEWTVGVGRDDFVRALEIIKALEFERIAHETLPRDGQCHFFAHKRVLLGDDLLHLRFERHQVFRGERLINFEVVVKAVVNGRTEADFCVGTETTHGRGQNVGTGVSQYTERPGVLFRDDHKSARRPQRRHQVVHLTVYRHRNRRLQQSCADGGHNVSPQRPRRYLARGTIGQREDNHFISRRGSGRTVDHEVRFPEWAGARA